MTTPYLPMCYIKTQFLHPDFTDGEKLSFQYYVNGYKLKQLYVLWIVHKIGWKNFIRIVWLSSVMIFSE